MFPPLKLKFGEESSLGKESSPGSVEESSLVKKDRNCAMEFSPSCLQMKPMESSSVAVESSPVALKSSPAAMESSQVVVGTSRLESMESSFTAGFPFTVKFSESGQANLDAWKESCSQLSMESSPLLYVEGLKGLDMTRSLKMYRNKSRKRSSIWSKMESSPDPADACPSKTKSTKGACTGLVVSAVEGVAALQTEFLSSDDSL